MEDERGHFRLDAVASDPDLAPGTPHRARSRRPRWRPERVEPERIQAEEGGRCRRLIERLDKVLPGRARRSPIAKSAPPQPPAFSRALSGQLWTDPAMRLPGLLPMPFNCTGVENLYCVGDLLPRPGVECCGLQWFRSRPSGRCRLGLNPGHCRTDWLPTCLEQAGRDVF